MKMLAVLLFLAVSQLFSLFWLVAQCWFLLFAVQQLEKEVNLGWICLIMKQEACAFGESLLEHQILHQILLQLLQPQLMMHHQYHHFERQLLQWDTMQPRRFYGDEWFVWC